MHKSVSLVAISNLETTEDGKGSHVDSWMIAFRRPRTASAVLALLVWAIGCAAFAVEPVQPAEVTIKNSRLIDFVSSVNGHRYAISIGIPFKPPPKEGYSVLYVLDGDAYFASAVEAVRANGNAPDVVVVGISYPDDARFTEGVLARHPYLPPWLTDSPPRMAAISLELEYDLTPPAPENVLAEQRFSADEPLPMVSDFGGVDDFLLTIEKDVKPRVAALVPINRADQVLFGHSLGGLAVVRALFREPNAFRTFIAASPSIWWGGRIVLKDEAAFDLAVKSRAAAPRVLITVGGEEETVPAKAPGGADVERLRARILMARMVGNARDLAMRLSALHGSENYTISPVAVFPEQAHGISPWPAIGRAVSFAFPPS